MSQCVAGEASSLGAVLREAAAKGSAGTYLRAHTDRLFDVLALQAEGASWVEVEVQFNFLLSDVAIWVDRAPPLLQAYHV